MTWLTGKPKRVISLRWPEDDSTGILKALERKYIPLASFPYSILDDQILRAVVNTNDNPTSYIYLAQIYLAIANNDDQVTFNVCSVLPSLTIALRIHNWDGTITNETTTHAQAAYGRLVVQGDMIGVSISSGEESDPEFGLDGFPPATSRVDYDYGARDRAQFDAPFGDEIVVWNWKIGSVNHVKIPQDEMAPLMHEGNFELVDQAFIALAGKVSSSFGTPSALLKTFSLSGDFTRTFSHGQNFEMDEDLDVIALSSSAMPDDILVNYHHRGSRITIIKKDLLTDALDIQPDSSDPDNLHMMRSHRNYIRTINGGVNAYLPAVCNNRVLLGTQISDDYGLSDFAIGQDVTREVFFICDFDQQRCSALINTSPEERIKLEEQIKSDNDVAQVTVVQRNYYTTIEDDADMEYPQFQAPPEWEEHLVDLWKIQEARQEGDSETPTLEFDEGPDEMKNIPRLAFTRSVFCLPPDVNNKDWKLDQFALSLCGIIYVPGFNERGHIFVFEE
ncbi:hypothetical protein Clacol_001268 [Clathrus columnatus]|uniref:Uncharacterized protein n=1 Tax=Clathrus columnatus TaxID=1419009 RepID=A0AAV5A198_9AGAM|nr:hypothetical protein Clacol_001268 [Clathrus columnatus]